MAGFYIISPLITGQEYLQGITQNKGSFSFGVLFQLVNNAAVITIGILFFVVLKKYSEKMAITILSTRLLV
ncbi:hypothetical protein C900_05789 [Fulvivirga imtechensis AK7]|uniref:Uncharacterized protein n=2 Tax=Fulvivirga TaxID=396811 RepID=L8JKV4_9BACT|nr:hypothetical protein C900_05789 [Fulvivirga imtechensis AK7]